MISLLRQPVKIVSSMRVFSSLELLECETYLQDSGLPVELTAMFIVALNPDLLLTSLFHLQSVTPHILVGFYRFAYDDN